MLLHKYQWPILDDSDLMPMPLDLLSTVQIPTRNTHADILPPMPEPPLDGMRASLNVMVSYTVKISKVFKEFNRADYPQKAIFLYFPYFKKLHFYYLEMVFNKDNLVGHSKLSSSSVYGNRQTVNFRKPAICTVTNKFEE
ncbi:hypothetical protein BD770DRAFT_424993 [Pilaira anomala]|nr:hypothetical protein BD770DRAFT_424993 [Pilaira anomala]